MTFTPPGVTDPADAMRDAVVQSQPDLAAQVAGLEAIVIRYRRQHERHLTLGAECRERAEKAEARIADLEVKLAQAVEDERDRLMIALDKRGHWDVAIILRRVGGAMLPADRAKARAASASAKPAKGEGRRTIGEPGYTRAAFADEEAAYLADPSEGPVETEAQRDARHFIAGLEQAGLWDGVSADAIREMFKIMGLEEARRTHENIGAIILDLEAEALADQEAEAVSFRREEEKTTTPPETTHER